MLSARFKPWHVPLFAAKYAYLRVRRFPILVHFEVTMRCNAPLAPGPKKRNSAMCDTSKMPAAARTASCSSMMPEY